MLQPVSYTHLDVYKRQVYDVAVDLRSDSETYGKWFGVILSAENKKQFYIPEGFAHGFLVLSDEAEFAYKCTDFYHPGDEGGLLWSDPEIGVDWPIEPDMQDVYKRQTWMLSMPFHRWTGTRGKERREGCLKVPYSCLYRLFWTFMCSQLPSMPLTPG